MPSFGDRIPIDFGSFVFKMRAGAYTLLFIFCMRIIYKRRGFSILLSLAAIVSYTLSTTYVILDLLRAATSYATDPSTPGIVTYTLRSGRPLAYPMSNVLISEVWFVPDFLPFS